MRPAAAPIVPSTRAAIEAYVHAKDENRPWLMQHAFAENAGLELAVRAGTMSLPPTSQGLASISDVLVRRFAQAYENVHTFCLASPPPDDEVAFSCDWLVGMSEKDSRAVRVGCGRYDWVFTPRPPRLAEHLTINIDLMETLAPVFITPVMSWLSQLPRPWCSAATALRDIPALAELQRVRQCLERAMRVAGNGRSPRRSQ